MLTCLLWLTISLQAAPQSRSIALATALWITTSGVQVCCHVSLLLLVVQMIPNDLMLQSSRKPQALPPACLAWQVRYLLLIFMVLKPAVPPLRTCTWSTMGTQPLLAVLLAVFIIVVIFLTYSFLLLCLLAQSHFPLLMVIPMIVLQLSNQLPIVVPETRPSSRCFGTIRKPKWQINGIKPATYPNHQWAAFTPVRKPLAEQLRKPLRLSSTMTVAPICWMTCSLLLSWSVTSKRGYFPLPPQPRQIRSI